MGIIHYKCYNNIFIFFIVCQEWLVREDNALAYQLQSQESKKL